MAEPSVEISQEDGPSVLALSVLSSVSQHMEPIKEYKSRKQEEIELNLFNRHQRLILYNMIAFIWSLLYLIYYVEAIDNIYNVNNTNSKIINELYLSYFVMIFIASFSIIVIKCIELKEWVNKKNKRYNKFVEFMHNLVGLIYFVSFIIHIAITWKESNEVCNNLNDEWFCKITFISSGWLSMYISWILCIDTIYRKTRNTASRIQYIIFFIATLMYLMCINHYRHKWNINFLTIIGEIGWWLLTISYFIALLLDCFIFNKIYNKIIRSLVSFMMIIGAILSVNRNTYIFNSISYKYEAWFLLITFSGFLSYQLHRKQNKLRVVIGEKKKESIAEEAPFHRQFEGSQDIDPLLISPAKKRKKRAKAFNVNHKKQRLIVYNIFIFVWSINNLVSFSDLLYLSNDNNNDYLINYYKLEISASIFTFILSIIMIFIEWNNNYNNTNLYQYLCSFFYWISSILQIAALINQLMSNECNKNNKNSNCITGIVGSQFLGILIPFILCFDIIWSIFNNIRWRILIQSFLIGLSCFLYYIGYSNYLQLEYNKNIPWYIRLSEYGWLMIAILFLVFSVTLLFRDKCSFTSPKYDGMILFIIGICYILSLGFSMSYPYGMYPIDNITKYDINKYNDSLLLISICFLISYEIQLLTIRQ